MFTGLGELGFEILNATDRHEGAKMTDRVADVRVRGPG